MRLAEEGAQSCRIPMGLRGQPEHPDVQAAIAKFEKAIEGSSVILGGVATSAEQGRAMRDRAIAHW